MPKEHPDDTVYFRQDADNTLRLNTFDYRVISMKYFPKGNFTVAKVLRITTSYGKDLPDLSRIQIAPMYHIKKQLDGTFIKTYIRKNYNIHCLVMDRFAVNELMRVSKPGKSGRCYSSVGYIPRFESIVTISKKKDDIQEVINIFPTNKIVAVKDEKEIFVVITERKLEHGIGNPPLADAEKSQKVTVVDLDKEPQPLTIKLQRLTREKEHPTREPSSQSINGHKLKKSCNIKILDTVSLNERKTREKPAKRQTFTTDLVTSKKKKSICNTEPNNQELKAESTMSTKFKKRTLRSAAVASYSQVSSALLKENSSESDNITHDEDEDFEPRKLKSCTRKTLKTVANQIKMESESNSDSEDWLNVQKFKRIFKSDQKTLSYKNPRHLRGKQGESSRNVDSSRSPSLERDSQIKSSSSSDAEVKSPSPQKYQNCRKAIKFEISPENTLFSSDESNSTTEPENQVVFSFAASKERASSSVQVPGFSYPWAESSACYTDDINGTWSHMFQITSQLSIDSVGNSTQTHPERLKDVSLRNVTELSDSAIPIDPKAGVRETKSTLFLNVIDDIGEYNPHARFAREFIDGAKFFENWLSNLSF